MGGKGSGGARIGAGRKPKRIETRGRKKGEVRIGAGRQPLGDKKRVPLNVWITPESKDVLRNVKESEGVSEGIAVDRLATFYTEHKGR